ncbi:MAG TPA: hypothetical protein VMR16_03555 [Candidatus Saccharimonadales bacterium]|nr:hypothetical protein [Candidatus Saccharimonadales bacterium]
MQRPRFLIIAIALIVTTIIFGTIYASQQQILRIGANSPQIQIAEDAAESLNAGINPISFTDTKVDIGKSLADFIIIYDKSGHIVSGDGYLNNQMPTVPIGVLKQSDGKDYSFVTWQPQTNVRIASVSVATNKYYVFSGRSLKEVEKQEDKQLQFAAFGWFCSVIVILAGAWINSKFVKKHSGK